MKVIAFYLPQFHRVPENDLWWGEGFTEWTNVKKAKPLFEGHNQPRVPLNNYYYDLSQNGVREWQENLAKDYGIYGLCYYHYWFKGKQLLQMPAQEKLRNRESTLPFCFSWANEPWTRAWDGSEKEVLMPQDYGNEVDWKEHFEYLLPFFKDERYIKVNNKPMFIIYRPSSIPHCKEMLNIWSRWAIEHGLDGIHFVETLTGFDNKRVFSFDAAIEFEPAYTMTHSKISLIDKIKGKVMNIASRAVKRENDENYIKLDYDYVWERILEKKGQDRNTQYKGAFVDWDNTPRRKNGVIIHGATPDKFKNYFGRQVDLAKQSGNKEEEFIFINAWNEWTEGTYLEPDEKNGFGYLQAISEVIARNKGEFY